MRVFIFTIFLILIIPSQTFAFFPQRSNDLGTNFPLLSSSTLPEVVVTPRSMSASACDPNHRTDCLANLSQPINLGGIQSLPSLTFALTTTNYMNQCFAGLHSLPAIETTSTIYFNDGFCLIRSVSGNSNSTKVDVNIGWTNNSSQLFPKIFKDSKINNLSTDYVNHLTEGSGNFTYDVSLDLVNRKWQRSGSYPYDFKGNASINFMLDMKSNINHLSDLERWSKNNSLAIDLEKSYWSSQTNGAINGTVGSFWHKTNDSLFMQISDFQFCNLGCQIQIKEDLNLVAALNNFGQDKVNGNVSSRAIHQESYLGYGQGIKNSENFYTGAVEWTDFRVAKEDAREWQQHLYYPTTGVKTEFVGQTNSNISFNPLLMTNNEQGSSRSAKKYKAERSQQMGSTPGQEINNEVYETNNQGDITRTGQGLVTEYHFDPQGQKQLHFTISGQYDSIDSQMKVIAEDLIAENLINQRIDPWRYLWANQYTQTYFPEGTIYVNGYFKADDQNATKFTMTTPKFEVLPQNIAYLKSDKTDLTSTQIAQFNQYINLLAEKGVNVQTNLQQLPNGSMVIVLGNPDDFNISKSSLENRQISVYTFNKKQCATETQPIAQAILSAFVSSSNDQTNSSIYADNLWLFTNNDLLGPLNTISGC